MENIFILYYLITVIIIITVFFIMSELFELILTWYYKMKERK